MGVESASGPQARRFAAYIEGLAKAAGHADRNVPLKNYCTGLLLPGERKSVEPMAARLDPANVRRMHQSLHHLVADAPWSDEVVLDATLDSVLPAMLKQGPVIAWVVDDTGFPKKGRHSVGVTANVAGKPEFPKRFHSRPSRRSHWLRSGEHVSAAFRKALCWPMPDMGRTPASAAPSPK